jgi:hypothetical protein
MKSKRENGEAYLPIGFHMVYTGHVITGDKIWGGEPTGIGWRDATIAEVMKRVEWCTGVSRKAYHEN